MKYKSKECTNCGAWTKSDLLDVETNKPVCRPCHNNSFALYRDMLMEKQRMREREMDTINPRIKQRTIFDAFAGTDESFTERIAQMELLCELWKANGVTWHDVTDTN